MFGLVTDGSMPGSRGGGGGAGGPDPLRFVRGGGLVWIFDG